jgi:hypothetical protein
MTKREPIIRSAQYEDAELRRQCREGTERYRLALIKAGHMTRWRPNRSRAMVVNGAECRN